jgi:hypothetical protein
MPMDETTDTDMLLAGQNNEDKSFKKDYNINVKLS